MESQPQNPEFRSNPENFHLSFFLSRRRDIVLASSVRPSVRSLHPSTLFVCPEPYLSNYWSDLIHSWYK